MITIQRYKYYLNYKVNSLKKLDFLKNNYIYILNSFSPQMGISCSVTQAVRKVQDEFVQHIFRSPSLLRGIFLFIKGRLESTLCDPQRLDRTRLELNHWQYKGTNNNWLFQIPGHIFSNPIRYSWHRKVIQKEYTYRYKK